MCVVLYGHVFEALGDYFRKILLRKDDGLCTGLEGARGCFYGQVGAFVARCRRRKCDGYHKILHCSYGLYFRSCAKLLVVRSDTDEFEIILAFVGDDDVVRSCSFAVIANDGEPDVGKRVFENGSMVLKVSEVERKIPNVVAASLAQT